MINNTNLILSVIVGIILAAIAIVWLSKKFFSVNAKQMQTNKKTGLGQRNEPLVPRSVDSDGSSTDTLTDSNNSLSEEPFDGVNINPEQKHRNVN
ncbi:MAG: hypothetical protein K0R14_2185 [Burkholderiales bacterium]|jgi:hypothetical protein|nr:hypothetical protein [Burkholderiales bacterium]